MDTFATLIVTSADAPTSRAIAAAFGPGGVPVTGKATDITAP